MASSNGRIGGSRPHPRLKSLVTAFSRAFLRLLVVLIGTAAPSTALSAPPAPSPKPAPTATTVQYTPPFTSAPPPKNNPPATPNPKKTSTKEKEGKDNQTLSELLKARANTAMEANELHETRAALLALLSTRFSINAVCNLGLVARRLKLAVEAAENLSRCVRAYSIVPIAARDIERYDELRAELAMALSMVATVRLLATDGAPVTIDGVPSGVASSDREIFLTPGPHVLKVEGRQEHLAFRASGTYKLDFTAPKPPPPPPKRKGIDPIEFAGWASAAASFGASAGLVTVAEILRRDADSKLGRAEGTNGGSACREPWRNPASCGSFESNSDTTITLYVAGGGTLLLGGALIAATRYYTTRMKPGAGLVVGLGSLGVEGAW